MVLLLRPFLLVAAFGRAVWLRWLGGKGPDLEGAGTWRGRFKLAVWLAMATLPGGAQEPVLPTIMCYEAMPAEPVLERPMSRVRMIWMALDPAQGPALETALLQAVRTGEVEVPASKLMLRVHRVLADHRERTRVHRVMCYKMSETGARQLGHRETALAQLEALARVRAAGRVAPDVLKKAESVLRAELGQLGLDPPPTAKETGTVAKLLTDWYAE